METYGLDSISGIKLIVDLERSLYIRVDPQWLIDYPTLSKLSIKVNKEISNQTDNVILNEGIGSLLKYVAIAAASSLII